MDLLDTEARGIVPRAMQQVFSQIEMNTQEQCTVYCSYLEIYNEKIFDLLQYERSRQVRCTCARVFVSLSLSVCVCVCVCVYVSVCISYS